MKDSACMQNKQKQVSSDLPIGIIGEEGRFSYGYNGTTYYVTEYCILDYYVTRTHLKFEEAKKLYEALVWVSYPAPKPSEVTKMIKRSRKKKLTGDNLLFFFIEWIRNVSQ